MLKVRTFLFLCLNFATCVDYWKYSWSVWRRKILPPFQHCQASCSCSGIEWMCLMKIVVSFLLRILAYLSELFIRYSCLYKLLYRDQNVIFFVVFALTSVVVYLIISHCWYSLTGHYVNLLAFYRDYSLLWCYCNVCFWWGWCSCISC